MGTASQFDLALQFLEQNGLKFDSVLPDPDARDAGLSAYLATALAQKDTHIFARLALAVADELDPA